LNEQVKDALLKGHIQPDEKDHFRRLDRAYGPSIYTVPWTISQGVVRIVRFQELFAFLVEVFFFRIKKNRIDRIMKPFKQNV